ncbi:hypothetical protein QUF64_05635 [Anaerolineales bacterium HSG6]|nr:hypothetical protein [Anaerolineales bacterium HSG6]
MLNRGINGCDIGIQIVGRAVAVAVRARDAVGTFDAGGYTVIIVVGILYIGRTVPVAVSLVTFDVVGGTVSVRVGACAIRTFLFGGDTVTVIVTVYAVVEAVTIAVGTGRASGTLIIFPFGF